MQDVHFGIRSYKLPIGCHIPYVLPFIPVIYHNRLIGTVAFHIALYVRIAYVSIVATCGKNQDNSFF